MRTFFLLGWAFLLVPCSCTLYHPAPIDLARDSAEWLDVSRRLCPAGSALSVEQLHHLGLLLNPELNKARLNYARSTAVAEHAGLWEDPSLSVGAERVLKENFFNKNAGLSLTLPVTGLPSLARKIAEQYKEADYWDMRAQERDFLARVDALRAIIMLLHERHHLMQERLLVIKDEMERIEKLHNMGEVSFAEYQTACQRVIDTRKEEQEMDKLHLEKHLEMAALVGLHPQSRHFELAGELPAGVPSALPVPSADELLSTLSLKSLMAGYGATEQELRREIRRQYPEISLSPGYNREDGADKIGLGFELSLPLWNRNREAIAGAKHDRALKEAEVIAEWRRLQQEAASLGDKQQQAIGHCRTEFAGLKQLEEAAQLQEKLFAMGETGLPELAEARHELYQRRLSYLDCLEELLEVRNALFYLTPQN